MNELINSNFKNYKIGISVVIATLGGSILYETLKFLNNGSLMPNEILIVIPEKFKSNIDINLLPNNAKVFLTNFSGQVAQRIYGFKKVEFLYTLQIDDDIILEKNCLKNLFQYSSCNQNSATCPTMLDINTNKYHHYLNEPFKNEFFKRFLYQIINGRNGYVSGKISKSGLGMGFSLNNLNPNEVEWLPGGCVMHFTPNLVCDNYYPMIGKAYAEDLFHSHILTKRKLKLFHIPSAVCYVDGYSSESSSFYTYIKIVYDSTRSLLKLNNYTQNNNSVRILLFQSIYFFIFLPFNMLKNIINTKLSNKF